MLLSRIVLATISAAVLYHGADAATDEVISNYADPGIRAFYLKNADEIGSLNSQLFDSKNDQTRLAALEVLTSKYPHAAEVMARSLVRDASEDVALYAVRILKAATVMGDHRAMRVGKSELPRVLHMMKRHEESISALREAISDGRRRIRNEAASYLASLSDEPTLEFIAADKTGLYSDVDAANLFTLAGGEVGEKYLERYVGQGDLEAQRTAITYLGAIPAYQQQIRSKYFLNSNAPIEARVDAARTLSTYDSGFAEYAAPVMANSLVVDPGLYVATVTGYVDVRAHKGDFDPQSAKLIFDMVEELRSSGRVSSGIVKKNLSTLSQRLEAVAEAIQ